MFRIERRLVNLGAARSVRVDSKKRAATDATDDTEVVAEDDFDAPFFDPAVNAQEILDDAKDRAAKIIEDAREEVAQIMLAAREEAEETQRQAWNEGYSKGAEEGKRSYDEQLSQKILENEESLKSVIKELHDERVHTFSKLEKDVAGLSLEVVKKIINPSEEALGGVFESLIRNALKQILPDGKIVLRVGMADYDRLFSSGNAVFELEGGVSVTASVIRDASLNEFDCVIDADNSTVNAGLDTQLKLIELAFSNVVTRKEVES